MSRNGDRPEKVTIDVVQMDAGWVYFEPGKEAPSHKELPHLLHRTVMVWLREHAAYNVRATLPIVSGGATVGIHLWYDEPSGEWEGDSDAEA